MILDKIVDKWKVKTLADDWKYSYDVIVIKRMRIFCISIAFGISPKHFRTDVADAIDILKAIAVATVTLI